MSHADGRDPDTQRAGRDVTVLDGQRVGERGAACPAVANPIAVTSLDAHEVFGRGGDLWCAGGDAAATAGVEAGRGAADRRRRRAQLVERTALALAAKGGRPCTDRDRGRSTAQRRPDTEPGPGGRSPAADLESDVVDRLGFVPYSGPPRVNRLTEDGAAARAGLLPGDTIIEANGTKIALRAT